MEWLSGVDPSLLLQEHGLMGLIVVGLLLFLRKLVGQLVDMVKNTTKVVEQNTVALKDVEKVTALIIEIVKDRK